MVGKQEKSILTTCHDAQQPIDQLWDEIKSRFGICPSFFKLAQHEPPVAWGLFRQAEFAYLDNPMPASFKERLFTWLSRFCEARYCVTRHCAFLLGRGRVAGDPGAAPLSAEQALALLRELMPDTEELPEHLRALEETPAPLTDWPDFDSDLGRRFRVACAVVFFNHGQTTPWLQALRRLLGPHRYEQLMLFLAFVRTAHFWTEVHPELEFEPDLEAMLREHEALVEPLLRGGDEAVRWELGRRLYDEMQSLRESQKSIEAIRDSEARFRAIFENAAVGIARVAPDGRWLEVNQRLCDIVGYTREELMTKTFTDIIHPEDLMADLRAMRRMLAGEIGTYLREKRYYRKDGSMAWANLTVSMARKADGSPDYFISVIEDISARKLAEEKLREIEEGLLLASKAAGLGVFEWDVQADRAVWENERMYEIFGHTHADGALSKAQLVENYVHPDDVATFGQALADGMNFGGPVHTSYRIRRKDGALRWLDLSANFELARDGAPIRMIGVLADITERKQVEEELRESQDRLQIFIEHAPAALAMFDREMRYLAVSRRWMADYHLGDGDIRGRSHYDVFPEISEQWKAVHRRALEGEAVRADEDRFVRADGIVQWLRWDVRPWYAANGAIGGIVVFTEDITEKKRAEEALRASELRFRTMISAIPNLSYETDADGANIFISDQWRAYTGMTAEESAGAGFIRAYHPDEAEDVLAQWRAAVLLGASFERECRIRAADGSYRWFLNRAQPGRDAEGRIVRWAGSLTDIDDQKQAERSLLESKERLNGIVSSAMDAIITVDEEQSIVLFNEAAERMFGCPGGEAMGRPLDRFIPERFRVAHHDGFLRFSETRGMGQLTALTALRANGAEFPIEASISKIEVGGRKLFTIILRDITERRQAEAEREQLAREQTARAEAEYAAERIRRLQAVTDSALAHLTLDDLLHEMLVRVRELLETDFAAILLLTEDGRSLVVRSTIGLDEALGVSIPVGKGVFGSIATDRAPLIVEDLSAVEVVNPILRRKARSMICAPLIVKGGLIGVIHADTAQLRRFAENDVRLLRLAADRVALAIEQRRLYEVEQLARRQAEEANRTKDEFLALVSHELRSPLNAILGYTRMLRFDPEDREDFNKVTGVIERSAKAQLQIVEDLLDSARIVTGKLRIEPSLVDLVPALEAALDTVRSAAEAKGITLVANFGQQPEQVLGDSTRLQQVVWNLLTNAVKFTPEGGRVELRMEGAANHIRIAVSDTGKGVEPEFLPFVFDRFRQADASSGRRYGGLGLGLSLAKHLVELHGGTITAASEGAGRGTTFTITLPRRHLEFIPPAPPAVTSREVRTEGAIPRDQALSLEGVSVLVVDDQEEARMVLTQILSEYGAQVTTVSSGMEALAILSRPPDGRRPDALILDIAMPDEDGYAVLKKVRALEAEHGAVAYQIPAIALTAHARVEDRLRALHAGFQMHVAKPVEPTELAVVIISLIKRFDIKPGS